MSEKLCTLRTQGGGSGGKQTETVLWTNSSPSSNFGWQEVTLSSDIDDFDYIKFDYKASTEASNKISLVVSVTELKTTSNTTNSYAIGLDAYRQSSGNLYIMDRSLYRVNDTTIHFNPCRTVNATQTNDAWCIPTSIIGIKNMVERTNITGIVKDFDNQLARLTATNQSYTATEDCVMTAYIAKTASNQTVGIKVNGTTNQDVLIFCGQSSPVNTELFVGTYSSNGSPYGIYLPKGTTAYTYGTGTFDVRFYKIKQT